MQQNTEYQEAILLALQSKPIYAGTVPEPCGADGSSRASHGGIAVSAATPVRSTVPDLSTATDLVHGITRALEAAGIWDAVAGARAAIDAHEAAMSHGERPWVVVRDLDRMVHALQDVRGVIDQRAAEGNAPPEHTPSGSLGEPAIALAAGDISDDVADCN